MPLLEINRTNPDAVALMTLQQVIGNAGDGNLVDGSLCCQEFREYLRLVSTDRLGTFLETCLAPGAALGFALQDIVNEIGRRFDFDVRFGRYRGVRGENGNDGTWKTSAGHHIVIEVKTTDAYRINLDVVAAYRTDLIRNGLISDKSSILIVVLRQDTGDLEAQVRGSRHAWDVRIISADALYKLLRVKEATEEDTLEQIEGLLVPFEYTRLDRIIDITFTAIHDIDETVESVVEVVAADELPGPHLQDRTPSTDLERVRKQTVQAVERALGVELRAKSRAKFVDPKGEETRVVCSVSKVYDDGGLWYAYHPHWDTFLSAVDRGYFVIAGVDMPTAFMIPRPMLSNVLPKLWTTERPDRMYWHIVARNDDGSWYLAGRDGLREPIDKYRITL